MAYRVGYEPPWARKGSLYAPAEPGGVARSLLVPAETAPDRYAPGAEPIPAAEKSPKPFWHGLAINPELQPVLLALERLMARTLETRERPFDFWRVDTVGLTNTAVTWLDQFGPMVAGQQRFLADRRAVIVVNQDPTNAVWVRQVDAAVPTGGFVAASGSVTMALSSRCKVFGIAVAAASNVSFYQFA